MNLLSSKTATQRGARPVHRAEARRRRVSVAVFACRVEARRRRSVSPNTSACPSASSLRNSVRSAIFIKPRLNERSSRIGTASSKTAVAFINRSKSHDSLPNPQFPHPIVGYCSLFTPIVAFLAHPGYIFSPTLSRFPAVTLMKTGSRRRTPKTRLQTFFGPNSGARKVNQGINIAGGVGAQRCPAEFPGRQYPT